MTLKMISCALRALRPSQPWSGAYPQCSSTGLLSKPALAELGEPLLEQAQRRGEPLSLLVFDFDDLASIEDLYGTHARREMLGLIGRRLRRVAGARGLAVRATRSRFVVLLPGCTRSVAIERATAKLGNACSFELGSPEHDLLLVPRVTALGTTAETDSIRQMVLRAKVAFRPPAAVAVAVAESSAAVPVPSRYLAAKRNFDLPDEPHVPAYQAYPATFPMPLSMDS